MVKGTMKEKLGTSNNNGLKGMLWAEALIVLQSVIYGFGDPISKIAFEVVPVYSMMSIRYSIAFLVCLILFSKRIVTTLRTAKLRTWLVPGMLIGMCYLLNNVALSMTDATSVAFLRTMSVIITPIFAFAFFGKRIDKWQAAIILLVIPGLYLLCVKGGLSGFGAGEIVTLCAACCMAGALVFISRYIDSVDPVSMTALQAACSAVLAIIGSFAFEGGVDVHVGSTKVWLIILYLAILCTFLGYLLQNLALTKISENTVAMLQTLCPVMTAFFSFILLGEKLSLHGIAGAVIIILCVICENYLQNRQKSS